MQVAIDRAGRVVIPKPLRDGLGLAPGTKLEIAERDGCLVLVPPPGGVRLVPRADGLAAETEDDVAPLTAASVRSILDQARR